MRGWLKDMGDETDGASIHLLCEDPGCAERGGVIVSLRASLMEFHGIEETTVAWFGVNKTSGIKFVSAHAANSGQPRALRTDQVEITI